MGVARLPIGSQKGRTMNRVLVMIVLLALQSETAETIRGRNGDSRSIDVVPFCNPPKIKMFVV
jgi:hypothetical protein